MDKGVKTITVSELVDQRGSRSLLSFSGRENVPGFAPYVANQQRVLKAGTEGFLRDVDAEAKTMEAWLGQTTPETKGLLRVWVDGRKDVCGSCDDIFKLFKEERPGITITVGTSTGQTKQY
jgi:hypothetical protein